MAIGCAAIHAVLDGGTVNEDVGMTHIALVDGLGTVNHATATAIHIAVVVSIGADGAAVDSDIGMSRITYDTIDSMGMGRIFVCEGAHRRNGTTTVHSVVNLRSAGNGDMGVAIHTARVIT